MRYNLMKHTTKKHKVFIYYRHIRMKYKKEYCEVAFMRGQIRETNK